MRRTGGPQAVLAAWGELPNFEPFKDFVGIFILDRPESDHLQQWRGYITTR